jgi:iron complex outermembrane receptor protein
MRLFCKTLGLLATSALAGSIVAAPAFAENAKARSAQAAAEPAEIGEVVVTARRVEERLQDVPISITVYNPQQLANRNIVNSTDLAAYTPSLAVNGRYGPDKSSFAIRGFSQDLNTLPTVGVYFADAVAPRLNSNITSGNGAGVGSMFDLQNVQVLKGPQGTLFGRNTTGGAILLVPQKPTDRFEGYVQGTVGNLGQKRVEAVLNVPISDKLRVRAGIDRNVADGYLHNQTGIGPSDFNDVDYLAGRLSIVADILPTLENYTIFTYAKSDTHGTIGKLAYCDRGAVTSTAILSRAAECAEFDRQTAAGYGYYDVANNVPNPFVKSRQWQAINTTTWHAADTLTVKNIFSYGQTEERYSFNLEGDNTPFPFVVVYPGPDNPQGHQWTMTEELQFQGRTSNDRFNWQAGGYMELSDPIGQQEQYSSIFNAICSNPYAFQCAPKTLSFGPVQVPIGYMSIARNTYYYKNYGLYAQGTFKLTDQLSITGGIRNTWDWQQEHADNIKVITSPAGPVAYSCSRAVTPTGAAGGVALLTNGACGIGRSFKESSHKPTWLINLDYKPNRDTLVYVKYARGYRGGGINEANLGAETWQPETVDNYEVGLKTSFNTIVRGTFNIDGFWNSFKDQQTSVFIPQCTAVMPGCTRPALTGINGIQNVGRSRLRGIEADATLLLTPDLRLDIGYAYLDAVVTGGSVPFCDTTAFICSQASFLTPGSVLPFSPKNRVTMTGTYTLPVPEDLGVVSVGATFTHTSSQYTNHGNDAAFAAGDIPFNSSIAPPTNLLNFNLNWRDVGGRPIDLDLFMTNVTGEKYFVANVNGLATIGAEYLILGQPRMFGARLKYRFGK